MAKTKMANAEFKTKLTVPEIGQRLNGVANQLKATVERIEASNPLSVFDGGPTNAIEVVLSGNVGFLGGLKHFRAGSAHDIWAVQVYVADLGTERDVTLIGLGESNALTGAYGAMNFGASKEKMEQILQALR